MPNAEALLLTAAHNAAETIQAIYKHLEAVDDAGGMETPAGRLETALMLRSLRSNLPRVRDQIMRPLSEAIRVKGQ